MTRFDDYLQYVLDTEIYDDNLDPQKTKPTRNAEQNEKKSLYDKYLTLAHLLEAQENKKPAMSTS